MQHGNYIRQHIVGDKVLFTLCLSPFSSRGIPFLRRPRISTSPVPITTIHPLLLGDNFYFDPPISAGENPRPLGQM
jgi:hypothetical protein